jgi:hypothetical protein
MSGSSGYALCEGPENWKQDAAAATSYTVETATVARTISKAPALREGGRTLCAEGQETAGGEG